MTGCTSRRLENLIQSPNAAPWWPGSIVTSFGRVEPPTLWVLERSKTSPMDHRKINEDGGVGVGCAKWNFPTDFPFFCSYLSRFGPGVDPYEYRCNKYRMEDGWWVEERKSLTWWTPWTPNTSRLQTKKNDLQYIPHLWIDGAGATGAGTARQSARNLRQSDTGTGLKDSFQSALHETMAFLKKSTS